MLTVTQLARRCGVSRTTLLYYESIRLIPPPPRSGSNYRYYNEADVQRLLQIRSYRDAGLTIDDIRAFEHKYEALRRQSRGCAQEAPC